MNRYAEKRSKRIEKLYYSRFEGDSVEKVAANLKELVEIANEMEMEMEMEIFEGLSIKAKEIIQEIQKGGKNDINNQH